MFVTCAGDLPAPGKLDVAQCQQSGNIAAQQQVVQSLPSKTSGSPEPAVSNAAPAETDVTSGTGRQSVQAAPALEQPGILSFVLPDAVAMQLDDKAESDMTTTTDPAKSVAVVQASPLHKLPKAIPTISPQAAMQQRMQHTRSSMESAKQPQVLPAALPVTFAVSTLSQPGPLFIKSFPETSLDSSTTLPQPSTRGSHGKVTSATSEAELWKSTMWGQGTAHKFGAEALASLSAALGTQGIQLTVLTLSHVDLGDAGMQVLCKGIGRCDLLASSIKTFRV